MSLATLGQLLAERQRLRDDWRRLQAHADDRDFLDQVDEIDERIDALDQECVELVESLVADRVNIPGLAIADLYDMTLDRLMRRDPRAGKRLRLILETARGMK